MPIAATYATARAATIIKWARLQQPSTVRLGSGCTAALGGQRWAADEVHSSVAADEVHSSVAADEVPSVPSVDRFEIGSSVAMGSSASGAPP